MAKDLTVSYPVVITHDNTDVDYPYEVYIPAFGGTRKELAWRTQS
ncbi:uncharacterized protein SN13T_2034 [Lactiplantibacillus plantarum]|nr:uncharacterized protein SN13T_2034 [Lactiplantibacillus plantarum]